MPTRITYEYDIRVILRLTFNEVKVLREVCDRHYDSVVRSLSAPGKNAVLNGATTLMALGDNKEYADVSFTYHQLNSLCKGLEGAKDRYEALLYTQCMQLLRDLQEEQKRYVLERAPTDPPAGG